MLFKFEAYVESIGKREVNEDSFLCDPQNGIFAVFDGLGGEKNGATASKKAREILHEQSQNLPPISERDCGEVELWLISTLQLIHEALVSDDKLGMTTASILVACESENDPNFIGINVGDSRVYGFMKDQCELRRLTKDDSSYDILHEYEELLENVETQEELDSNPGLKFQFERRAAVNLALGARFYNSPTPSIYPIENFYSFLLTTDGIHDNSTRKEILSVLLDQNLRSSQVPMALVQVALKRSGEETHIRAKRDDMTALYVLPIFN